jgi:hypothetical protein
LKVMLRIVAVLAALSVLFTVWFIASFAAAGGIRSLVASGLLGILTLVGWVVSLTAGPFAAVQLWRCKEAGRRAGMILFGYGLGYYVIGLFILRQPSAQVGQIIAAATIYATPLILLAMPAARKVCARLTKIAVCGVL